MNKSIENLKKLKSFHNGSYGADIDKAIKALEQESKTGHWIVEVWNNKEHHICSVCQKVVDYEPCYHYCPYCGAKLEEEREDKGMYIACKKCKYNHNGECNFYYMGSGNEIDMPCYREKELIKKAADNFLQAFVGAESE